MVIYMVYNDTFYTYIYPIHIYHIPYTTSHRRGSNIQSNFRQRVLCLDGCCCVFCGDSDKAHLQAAHTFGVLREEDVPAGDTEYLRQYKIIDTYETCSVTTLCSECHSAFDTLLCCVEVSTDTDGTATDHVYCVVEVEVASALKLSPTYLYILCTTIANSKYLQVVYCSTSSATDDGVGLCNYLEVSHSTDCTMIEVVLCKVVLLLLLL